MCFFPFYKLENSITTDKIKLDFDKQFRRRLDRRNQKKKKTVLEETMPESELCFSSTAPLSPAATSGRKTRYMC
jgi:hypothetical protein